MKTEIAKVLLSSPDYLEFERYIQEEILKAERKAIESIHSWTIDHESANRAKFYQEVINMPRNKIKAGKMWESKTKM